MRRTYTIGRDESCDIVIFDSTSVVSRKHAVLKIDGKRCYLIDQSTNGTYRNGIRLIPNVEYPVNKGEDISFGNVASLDWNAIPELQKMSFPVWLYIFIPTIILLLAGCVYYFWPRVQAQNPVESEIFTTDSLNRAQAPNIETEKKDSLIVLENVLSKKKVAKKAPIKTKTQVVSQKSFDDYKDADDDVTQDAL